MRLGKVFDPEHPLTLKEFFDSRLCLNLYASAHHIVSIWQAQIKEEPARETNENFFVEFLLDEKTMRNGRHKMMKKNHWLIAPFVVFSFYNFFFFIPFFTPSLVTHDGYRLKVISSRQQFYYDSLSLSRLYYYYRAFYDYYSAVLLSLFHFSSWKFVVYFIIFIRDGGRWRRRRRNEVNSLLYFT